MLCFTCQDLKPASSKTGVARYKSTASNHCQMLHLVGFCCCFFLVSNIMGSLFSLFKMLIWIPCIYLSINKSTSTIVYPDCFPHRLSVCLKSNMHFFLRLFPTSYILCAFVPYRCFSQYIQDVRAGTTPVLALPHFSLQSVLKLPPLGSKGGPLSLLGREPAPFPPPHALVTSPGSVCGCACVSVCIC